MADILVVGLSARALSQSARAGGYAPLAADFFGDLDLREAAEASVKIDGDLKRGFEWDHLIGGLDALAAGRSPRGIVCGTGFEDRPEFLERLAERWPLWGNPAATVARAKDPQLLAELCGRLGIPHPRLSLALPAAGDWVRKRKGSAGGTHVAACVGEEAGAGPSAGPYRRDDGDVYWQERVAGEAVAALVLGCHEGALVLGFSAQWTDPAPAAPFRYGGAARPAPLSPAIETALAEAAASVVEASGLVGLNSVDFLVDPDGWTLIEINPRPGATLDVFQPEGESLFALHVEACRGRMPAERPTFEGVAAACIVYARRAVASVPSLAWPDWTADRQAPGTSIEIGAPVCTVLAQAGDPAVARRLAEERAGVIRTAVGAG